MDGNIMQNVLVMYSYVMNNLNKIKTIIISDLNLNLRFNRIYK